MARRGGHYTVVVDTNDDVVVRIGGRCFTFNDERPYLPADEPPQTCLRWIDGRVVSSSSSSAEIASQEEQDIYHLRWPEWTGRRSPCCNGNAALIALHTRDHAFLRRSIPGLSVQQCTGYNVIHIDQGVLITTTGPVRNVLLLVDETREYKKAVRNGQIEIDLVLYDSATGQGAQSTFCNASVLSSVTDRPAPVASPNCIQLHTTDDLTIYGIDLQSWLNLNIDAPATPETPLTTEEVLH